MATYISSSSSSDEEESMLNTSLQSQQRMDTSSILDEPQEASVVIQPTTPDRPPVIARKSSTDQRAQAQSMETTVPNRSNSKTHYSWPSTSWRTKSSHSPSGTCHHHAKEGPPVAIVTPDGEGSSAFSLTYERKAPPPHRRRNVIFGAILGLLLLAIAILLIVLLLSEKDTTDTIRGGGGTEITGNPPTSAPEIATLAPHAAPGTTLAPMDPPPTASPQAPQVMPPTPESAPQVALPSPDLPMTLSPTTLPTSYPTSSTEKPTASQSPTSSPTAPPLNDNCDTAHRLVVGSNVVEGNLDDASIRIDDDDDQVVGCGTTTTTNTRGLWYTVTGDNVVLVVSTCWSDDSISGSSTTQLTLYQGDDDCNDVFPDCALWTTPDCTNHETLRFFAQKGVTYRLRVTGSGTFGLRVTRETNGSCQDATLVPVAGTKTMVGSLYAATEAFLVDCRERTGEVGFAWYRVQGTGGWMMATTCGKTTSLINGIHLDVRLGPCEVNEYCLSGGVRDSDCGSGHQLVWESNAGTDYFVQVFSTTKSYVGDHFDLSIRTFVPVINDLCKASIPLQVGQAVSGSTLFATTDASAVPLTENSKECHWLQENQPGVWYTIVGTGDRLLASTCHETTSYASRVSVFVGTCGILECVPVEIQACGEKDSVYWDSIEGETYRILVHGGGFDTLPDVGDFRLLVDIFETEPNDFCLNAIDLTFTDDSGVSVNGSTFWATPDDPISCGDPDPESEAAGVWYRLEGTGRNMIASTCNVETTYDTKLTVFQGDDCGSLSCVIANDNFCGEQSSVRWTARANTVYYIWVHGRQFHSVGDFVLQVENYTPISPNDFCDDAAAVVPGEFVQGTTRGSSFDNAEYCGAPDTAPGGRSTAPGVWYKIEGTGRRLTLSLCNDFTDFNSYISVFKGSNCYELQCEGGNAFGGTGCGFKSRFSFGSSVGTTYHVLIHGFSERVGNFALNVTEPAPTVPNDYCDDAVSLPTEMEIVWMNSTRGATLDDIPTCNGVAEGGEGSGGVWYQVLGTGGVMSADTCGYRSARISVLTGKCSDSFDCVRADQASCEGGGAKVVWQTTPGTRYFILVHGTGDFELRFQPRYVSPQPNDLCSTDEIISPARASKVQLGSTIESSFDPLIVDCNGQVPGPGVWYTIFGMGKRLQVDTCDSRTNFDTKLSVFTGLECSSLTCIATDDDACGSQSSIQFDTTIGDLYYVLVHGYDGNGKEEGDFGLSVRDAEFQ